MRQLYDTPNKLAKKYSKRQRPVRHEEIKTSHWSSGAVEQVGIAL